MKCYCQGTNAALGFCHITQLGKQTFYFSIASETVDELSVKALFDDAVDGD